MDFLNDKMIIIWNDIYYAFHTIASTNTENMSYAQSKITYSLQISNEQYFLKS